MWDLYPICVMLKEISAERLAWTLDSSLHSRALRQASAPPGLSFLNRKKVNKTYFKRKL